MLLLDQILNKKLGKPFIKMPTDESLPVLQPAEVVSQILILTVSCRKQFLQTGLRNSMLNLTLIMPPISFLMRMKLTILMTTIKM